MRLSSSQIEAIKQKPEHIFGAQVETWLFGSRVDDNQRGFTLVELVMAMIIIGIIAAIAAPRFFNNNVFQSRGFADQAQASLRYAQKAAVAQRRLVCVTFPSTSRMVLRTAANFADVACNTDLASPSGSYPAGQTTYTVDAPSGVTLGGAVAFNFDAQGRPNPPPGAISVSGYATPIVVEAETGYVHSP
jgi:MSHA pilin protein MshC